MPILQFNYRSKIIIVCMCVCVCVCVTIKLLKYNLTIPSTCKYSIIQSPSAQLLWFLTHFAPLFKHSGSPPPHTHIYFNFQFQSFIFSYINHNTRESENKLTDTIYVY